MKAKKALFNNRVFDYVQKFGALRRGRLVGSDGPRGMGIYHPLELRLKVRPDSRCADMEAPLIPPHVGRAGSQL